MKCLQYQVVILVIMQMVVTVDMARALEAAIQGAAQVARLLVLLDLVWVQSLLLALWRLLLALLEQQ